MGKAWLSGAGATGVAAMAFAALALATPADAHRSSGPAASEVDSARVAAMERTVSGFGMVEPILCVGFSDAYVGQSKGIVPEDLRDPAPELLDLLAAEGRRVVPASSCELRGERHRIGYYHTGTGERAQIVWAGPGVEDEAGVRIHTVVWHSLIGSRGEDCTFVRGVESWAVATCSSIWTA
ncbi:hypothetical protein WI460_14965 [Gemmatimonadota bacterium Y43]|uniref:hypothetical protein n=1 Tax=Gaopeijia maritima TaxID=3119007 RepID=UPI0032933B2A